MSRTSNINEQPDRRGERLPRILISDYFNEQGKHIRNKGYIDEIKAVGNMRMITLNVKGCSQIKV